MTMRFAQLAREARQRSRVTLREVAETLGMSIAYVSEVERGNRQAPSMKRAERWAAAVRGDPVAFREAALADREDDQVSPEYVAEYGRRATPFLDGTYEGPGNRPRVFVSSTISDFRDLRSALKSWLTDLGIEVRMSEFNDFSRRPEQGTFDSCFGAIEGCDYYLLLVGGRKGSEYEPGVSVTQEEYRRAAALAKQGRLKPIIFIRAEVLTALSQRAAILRQLRESDADIHAMNNASRATIEALQDPEFAASFVEEIRATEFEREGTEGRAGALWYYRFQDFDDIADALRVNLRLYGSVNRQILLTNLKWELEENIALLVGKHRGGPFPHSNWLSAGRNRINLDTSDIQPVLLGAKQAQRVTTFWMLNMTTAEKLRTPALKAAIESGEFLIYRRQAVRLEAGPVHTIMQALDAAIDRYRGLCSSLEERREQWTTLIGAAAGKRPQVAINKDTLVFLFATHDRMVDIVRLSVALLRYILDPTGGVRMPTLTPISPFKEAIRGLEAEQVTHEEVERWASDKVKWGWMTGEHVYSGAEAGAALADNPEYWSPILEMAKQQVRDFLEEHGEQFKQILETEGSDAAVTWLQRSLLEQSLS